MVTDQELAGHVESLLRQVAAAYPAGYAAGVSGDLVVRQLEAKLGLDLAHKADFIRDHVALLLSPPPPPRDYFAAPPQFHHPHVGFSSRPQPQVGGSPAGGVSPYAALPSHHDINFRYQSQCPIVAAPQFHSAVSVVQQQQQQQQVASMAAAAASMAAAAVVGNSPAPTASAKKESASSGKRKGGPGGLNKVCGVSPELQAIVGEPTMARTEIVKQLWAYIRKNNLQDPNNKRKIICNDELRLVFETDCTDMFKMNKLLAKHIIPLEPTKVSRSNSKKPKSVTAELQPLVDADVEQVPLGISDALATFFGTGEREMLESEAFGRMWEHIRSNKLEDPKDPMVILCDSKLQQLFGCESFSALSVPELLSHHLFKQA